MLTSRDGTGVVLSADRATKPQGPFQCPGCDGPTILHKGTARCHHFQHAASGACTFGAGETEQHREAKYGIRDLLQQRGLEAQLEVRLDSCVPDVLAVLPSGRYLAVELQRAKLTADAVWARTAVLRRNGCVVLWVAVPRQDQFMFGSEGFRFWGGQMKAGPRCFWSAYRPSEMERAFSAVNGGTRFIWAGDTLQQIQLSKMPRWVDGGDFGPTYETVYKDRFSYVLQPLNRSTHMSVFNNQIRFVPA